MVYVQYLCVTMRLGKFHNYFRPFHLLFRGLGIGLGATSSIKGNRFVRPRQLSDYTKWVSDQQELMQQEKMPDWEISNDMFDDDCGGDVDFLTDTILTRLRTSEGLNLYQLRSDHGDEAYHSVMRGAQLAIDLNLAVTFYDTESHQNHLRLVDPEGFLFSNTIISTIFVELGVLETP